MSLSLNMPTLGIRFDIDKIHEYVDSSAYGRGAWKVFWRAVDINTLKDWRDTLLYECDSTGTLNDKENVCCISIQSIDKALLNRIRDSLEKSMEYKKVAASPMFLEDDRARAEPLLEAGRIDHMGNVTGEKAYWSAPALDFVRKEKS